MRPRNQPPEDIRQSFAGCEKLDMASVLKGHGFSRAENAYKMNWASAPEGCPSRNFAALFPRPVELNRRRYIPLTCRK